MSFRGTRRRQQRGRRRRQWKSRLRRHWWWQLHPAGGTNDRPPHPRGWGGYDETFCGGWVSWVICEGVGSRRHNTSIFRGRGLRRSAILSADTTRCAASTLGTVDVCTGIARPPVCLPPLVFCGGIARPSSAPQQARIPLHTHANIVVRSWGHALTHTALPVTMLTRKAIHNHCNRTGPAAREMSAASTTCAVRARHTRHVRPVQ